MCTHMQNHLMCVISRLVSTFIVCHNYCPHGVYFLYFSVILLLDYNLLQSSSNSILATLDCQNNYSQQVLHYVMETCPFDINYT